MITQEQKYHLLHCLFAAALFLLIGFWINRNLVITGLYMDDLYLWSLFGETKLFEYLFPVGSQRFRVVFNVLAYLVLKPMGANLFLIVPINICINTTIAWWLFYMAYKISESRWIGYYIGSLFMVSHFAYYQIGQLYGLLESFSMLGTLLILYCLYQFLNSKKANSQLYFGAANIIYFLNCFVHERYLVLIVPIILTLLMKKSLWKEHRPKQTQWLMAAGSFVMVMVIRLMAIGSLSPAGTGGTDVADTFSISGALKFAVNQVMYLFGINAGPAYLNGIEWQEVPLQMQMLVGAGAISLLGFIGTFLVTLIKDKQERKKHLCNGMLFVVFIAMCIGASSVTIRLEMRWVYVSFAIALCLLAYFWKAVKAARQRRVVFCILSALYLICMLPVEIFYRSYYPNLYFWDKQQQYNSLADLTYGTYGDEVFSKNIVVLGNRFEMDDFSARTILKPYNKNWEYPNRTIGFAENIYEFGLVSNNMLILAEDQQNNRYLDVTSFVKKLKCDVKYGYYDDHWMDQQAELSVISGENGMIQLTGVFPGVLTGDEEIEILVNGKDLIRYPVEEYEISIEIEAVPYSRCTLEISSNFYMQDALEQRGEYPLCAIIDIKAD